MELSLPQDVVMMEDEDDDDDDMELHNDVLMIEQMSAAATPEVMLEGTENNMLVPFAVNRPASSMAGDLVEMAVTPTLMISGESAGEGSSSGGLVGGSHTNRSLVERRTKEDKSGGGGGGMMADGEEETVLVDESIISLLLKLHSQLSNTLDSFSLDDVDAEEMDDPASGSSSRQEAPPTSGNSRIGDGPLFIGNLLRKIAKLDGDCAREMRAIRQRLWPNQRERQAEQKSRELKEKEDRSVRAKQRQMKLMQEFANKQKRFMEQAAAAESGGAGGGGPEVASGGGGGGVPVHEEAVETDEDEPVEKVYDCIICNQTSASTENDPIGLVVLVESSSVTGHRRRSGERSKLPLCDEDREEAGPMLSMSQEFNRRIELMSEAYGKESWYFGQNLGWEGGVHVQSCGHHVHLTCHDAYRHSLFTSQRPQNLMIERGEFLCPFCRQLSNCVLPLGSQKESVLRRGSSGGGQRQQQQQFKFFELVHELRVIFMNSSPVAPTRRSDAIRRAMDVMTESIQQQHNRVLPNIQHTMLLPLSIARTNLEAEVIQRGGSLCSNNEVRYKPKRDCIVPLLNVLSTHLRIIANLPMEWRCWARLCGLPMEESKEEGAGRIPLLVTDPTALMLKYILLSPVHLSQGGKLSQNKSNVNCDYFINWCLLSLPPFRSLYVHRQGDIQPALLPSRAAAVRQLGQAATGADPAALPVARRHKRGACQGPGLCNGADAERAGHQLCGGNGHHASSGAAAGQRRADDGCDDESAGAGAAGAVLAVPASGRPHPAPHVHGGVAGRGPAESGVCAARVLPGAGAEWDGLAGL